MSQKILRIKKFEIMSINLKRTKKKKIREGPQLAKV